MRVEDWAFKYFGRVIYFPVILIKSSKLAVDNTGIAFEDVIIETAKDAKKNTSKITAIIPKGLAYDPKDEDFNEFRGCFSDLTISEDGLLYKYDKIVIPKSMVYSIVKATHVNSHMGAKACKRLLNDTYFICKPNGRRISQTLFGLPNQHTKNAFQSIISSEIPPNRIRNWYLSISATKHHLENIFW